ncbi:MAG: phospholipid carrier-dependent glycosyltransferase, partial [Chloroflexota bacterium]
DFFHDYTPGYLYILWLLGVVGGALGGVGVALVKVPAILADLAIGWLVWSMLLELGARRKLALAAALVAVVNPISWFDSVVWGQVDAVGVVFLLLGLRELWRDHPERSAILAVTAALIKPQLGILIPILALVTIRRALWPVRKAAEGVPADHLAAPGATGIQARFLAREARTDHPIRIVTTALAALITTVALCLPFGLSVLELTAQAPFVKSGLLSQIFATASGYPYLSVNAFNPWALIAGDSGSSLANAGLWVCDGPWGAAACGSGVASFGSIPPVLVGGVLMLAVTLAISLVAAWRPDRLTILLSLTLLALAFYVVPTRVHERYAYPVFALAILLAAISWRWRIAYALLSVTVFLNMYAVLTNPFYKNPGISDWFGIGPGLRSAEGVIVLALLNVLVFLWAFAELRARGRARLAAELDDEWALATAEDDGLEAVEWPVEGEVPSRVTTGAQVPAERPIAPPAAFEPDMRLPAAPPGGSAGWAPATLVPAAATTATTATTTAPVPTWSLRPSIDEAGVVGWLKARIGEAPIRPDRSASLRGERGGRLDRLDLFLVVILILGTLLLRTFRLAEPYQMHFDEVYHARTAAEFLQYWRYGLSHDIYEWTHPHLAKYVMAAGIVAWGGDHIESTSDLGVPVRADAIEPRRADPATGQRAGERLHVATGSEIRTYDLVTRKLVSIVAAPGAGTLAIDQTNNQLVIGYDDGRIATLDLDLIGQGGVQAGLEPNVLATVDHPVVHLLATSDGADVVAASTGRVTTVDLQTGAIVGSLDLPGVADLAPASSGPAIVAAIGDVKDPAAIAKDLARILSTNAADYTALFAAAKPGSTVVLGVAGTAEKRKALDAAIAAGTLAGLRVDTVTRVAVAAEGGVSFIATERGALISAIKVAGGAHGLALVTGLDYTKLYATAGTADAPKYDVIAVGGDVAKEGPVDQGINLGLKPLPGPGTSVVYDAASQMVHILGLAPGATAAGPWTVYVVEPHGNAVYADARLPDGFVPTAIGGDFNPDYPSEDRQQLLVFNGAGTSAAIDAGSHDFSWRLPGVIAGALTAGLLYLLTRILFRRRLVAGLVGLFVIADGMFFVQSRIGMNDVYVGLLIIAAYTLFAAIWTGWWRGRAVFWV